MSVLPNIEIHPTHFLHENLTCRSVKHCYLHIPVNSSTWGKNTCQNFGFVTGRENKINDDYTIMVFLRDPIDRWLSGLTQWLVARLPQHTNLLQIRDNQAWLDTLFYLVHVDEHTQKQQWFLQGLDTSKMKFFMVNETLSQTVTDYLNQLFGTCWPIMSPKNESTLEGGKLIPKQYFRQVLESNPTYLNHVKQAFRSDYDFIKSLHFENHTDKKFQYYD